MTLYEYLKNCEEGTEVTVTDKVYDTETYFYADFDEDDDWQNCMIELSKLVEIEIKKNCVICNFSEIIEKHIDKIVEADLFIDNDIDEIMYDFDNIISGYVSENWMKKFVKCLGR